MRKFLPYFLLLFIAAFTSKAQDIHYSQFYYSPLTFNPALTGSMDGTYRISGIYKNQWSSISSPFVYSTPSISADAKLFSGKFNGNYLGVGLLLLNDRSGDGNLRNFTAMLSLAYHQSLDREGNYHLAVGLQGGLVQKSIDFNNLNFSDEFDGLGFNNITAENFKYQQIAYSDFSAGALIYGVPNNHSRFQIGAAAFHLTTPTETFFESSDNQLDMRFVVHGSYAARVSKRFTSFLSHNTKFKTTIMNLFGVRTLDIIPINLRGEYLKYFTSVFSTGCVTTLFPQWEL